MSHGVSLFSWLFSDFITQTDMGEEVIADERTRRKISRKSLVVANCRKSQVKSMEIIFTNRYRYNTSVHILFRNVHKHLTSVIYKYLYYPLIFLLNTSFDHQTNGKFRLVSMNHHMIESNERAMAWSNSNINWITYLFTCS
jgi:hypothetical protein